MAGQTVSAAERAPRTRPRDRRARIINAAVVLFHRNGYHSVGMEDIASAVGITAGALYRHFRDKQDLLAEAMLAVIDEYLELAAAAADDGLDAVLHALARRAIESRERGPLWQKHARDLSGDQQAEVRHRLRTVANLVVSALAATRPELPEADRDLLTWAALAVIGSPSEHSVTLPMPRFEQLLTRCAGQVCRTSLLPARRLGGKPARVPATGLSPVSRREVLLVTAGRLFREHGFDAVTMEAIGAAAGISGPGVYNHFDSKSDLLAAVLDRGRETLQFGLSGALAGAQTLDQALEPVVRSYVVPAMRPDGLPGLLYSATHHVPEPRREHGRRIQRDYIDEWVRLLPVGQAEGRVVVHAAIALINSLVLIPHLRSRSGFGDEVVRLALDILRTDLTDA